MDTHTQFWWLPAIIRSYSENARTCVKWQWNALDCYLIAQPAKPGVQSSNTSRVSFTVISHTPRRSHFYHIHSVQTELRWPNWIVGPQPKVGSARKSESHGPGNGVSRRRRPNSDIHSVLWKIAKPWDAQRTTHGWWLGGPYQFWVVHQSIICSEHEIN